MDEKLNPRDELLKTAKQLQIFGTVLVVASIAVGLLFSSVAPPYMAAAMASTGFVMFCVGRYMAWLNQR